MKKQVSRITISIGLGGLLALSVFACPQQKANEDALAALLIARALGLVAISPGNCPPGQECPSATEGGRWAAASYALQGASCARCPIAITASDHDPNAANPEVLRWIAADERASITELPGDAGSLWLWELDQSGHFQRSPAVLLPRM